LNLPDIILLGHGSRRGIDTDEGLKDAAGRLQQRVGPGVRVRMAGFEFTRPSIPEAIEMLVAEGSRRMVLVPFFLFDGKHITVEIPEELEKIRAQYPDVDLTYARTLGADIRLVEIVAERVEETGLGDGVILVNRGSRLEYDPGDRLRELARLIENRLGARVAPAQAEYESPTILEAADSLVQAGLNRIAVVPYIFFPGKVLNVNIIPAVEEARNRFPAAHFAVARTLGVDDRLIDLALQRAHEALN
jgi:sirohydrochlorin ferrochelatase